MVLPGFAASPGVGEETYSDAFARYLRKQESLWEFPL